MKFNPETGTFEEEKKKINLWKFVVIGAIVLVIVLAVTLFFIGDETLEKLGISPNLFNSGTSAYGDVNDDGKVDASDAHYVLQYSIGKKELDKDAKKSADVDGNGKIDQLDAQLILKKSAKLIVSFPIEEGVYGYNAGDVDQDGKITAADARLVLRYASGQTVLTEYQQTLADVSGDGSVTQLDSELILRFSVKTIDTFPIVDSKYKYYTLGDVNEDGVVNSSDARLVQQAAEGMITLNAIQQLAADVNNDGVIDKADAELVLQASVGLTDLDTNVNTNSNANASTNDNSSSKDKNNNSKGDSGSSGSSSSDSTVKPTTPPAEQNLVYGDVNGDGSINSEDARLASRHASGIITLENIQFLCADVDGNGKVEAFDAELILKYSVKKIARLDPDAKYYILGDVDGDGVLTQADANLILKNSVGLVEFDEVQKKAGDYNKDGKINSDDSREVLRKASNM